MILAGPMPVKKGSKMRTIAIINQKGGCGKTTISINLAAVLAFQGHKTLLVDMDPQSHCAVGLAVPEDQIEKNVYDVLISAHSSTQTVFMQVVWQVSQDLDLAPAGIELAALEQQLAGCDGREDCLRDALADQGVHYDYAIIDCPPSVGLLTFNALRAADEVIIPVETGYFALHGLERQIETLKVLQEQCRQQQSFRILGSMYDVRTKLAREVWNELRKNYQGYMFKAAVNFNTKLKEAASFGQPITEYDPSSKGMRDFLALAQEVTAEPASQPASKEEVERVEVKLEAISRSADDLLAESKVLIGQNVQQQEAVASLEEKIDNFYGIRQEAGRVEFAVLYPQAQKVQLAGDFNGWQPEATTLLSGDGNGRWNIEMALQAGTYQYRYVVDGRWQQDPYNHQVVENPFGDLNSVVEVK